MDPTTNTPTPNEAPVAPAPEAPAAPAPEAPAAPAPEAPAAPAPEAPAAPAAPAINPDVANAALNPPVNPVIAPGASAAPGAPAAPNAPTMSMNQMFQSQPVNQVGGVLDDMTPIAVPEGPKPVDPVEEELKAPLKAAEPVPGSIGSAVSVPPEGGAPNNVAFNDPAQGGENPMTANAAPQIKKNSIFDKLTAKTKMNKNTLILLCVVAGVVLVGLIVLLVMVATGAL